MGRFDGATSVGDTPYHYVSWLAVHLNRNNYERASHEANKQKE